MRTLTIDIGGTGIKLLPIDDEGRALAKRHRELTPKPSDARRGHGGDPRDGRRPEAVRPGERRLSWRRPPRCRQDRAEPRHPTVAGIQPAAGPSLRCAASRHGCSTTPSSRDTAVINAKGVEIVLTLGTGLGAGLYVDGHLVPNLELGHHPLRNGKTYEELVGDAELSRVGKKAWRKRVAFVIETLERIFNYDTLHIGGGNAKKLKGPLPDNVRLFDNVDGLAGGVRPWQRD